MADLLEEDKNLFEMNPAQEQTIRDIAETETYASVMAQSILMTVFNEEFDHPIMRKQIGGTKNMQVNNNKGKTHAMNNVYAIIYPNPNSGSMNLEYQFEKDATGEFLIYNVTGKQILRYNLKEDSGIIDIKNNKLQPGIYFYKVISNNITIVSNKLIIL